MFGMVRKYFARKTNQKRNLVHIEFEPICESEKDPNPDPPAGSVRANRQEGITLLSINFAEMKCSPSRMTG